MAILLAPQVIAVERFNANSLSMDDLYLKPLESEEFNRTLLLAIQEASPDGILVVDENAEVVSFNRRFLEIWQIPREYIQDDGSRDGVLTDEALLAVARQQLVDCPGFIERVQRLYASPHVRDDTEIEFRDGRTIERHSVGLFNDEKKYLGRVWFFRDITEHKRVQFALQELAWSDPLTGARNRAYFFSQGEDELAKAQRYQHPLTVAMADLDHFKQINDQYGHAAGDTVLKTVCQRWQGHLRSVDVLARIGGEEFAFLMPETGLENAGTVAERLRLMVADQGIPVEGGEVHCTASIGISQVRVEDKSIDQALSRADAALYRAKELGRDRVVVNP